MIPRGGGGGGARHPPIRSPVGYSRGAGEPWRRWDAIFGVPCRSPLVFLRERSSGGCGRSSGSIFGRCAGADAAVAAGSAA